MFFDTGHSDHDPLLLGNFGEDNVAEQIRSIGDAVSDVISKTRSRNSYSGYIQQPIPVQNVLLIIGVGYLAVKVLEVIVKGRR